MWSHIWIFPYSELWILKSSKLWLSLLWMQFKQLHIEAWKGQDFNGVWTCDLAISVRCSNQLSYEAIDVGSWSFVTLGAVIFDFIYYFTSILHGLIRTHKWPAPNISGFIAQLVRASHRYREVTGSNPVEVLTFSGFYTQLFITAMIIAYLKVINYSKVKRT